MFVFALGVLPSGATPRRRLAAVLLIGLAASAHQALVGDLYTTVSDMFAKKDIATIVGLGGMAGSSAASSSLDLRPRLDRYHTLERHRVHHPLRVCTSAYLLAFAFHHLLPPASSPSNRTR